ncbi:MAG TPA: STAS domain-containing protein [Pseudolabrys sp.]|jgi:anti-anti-sigma factor|nr:STAS domain-containing protein [Pseudolabrys sp.]
MEIKTEIDGNIAVVLLSGRLEAVTSSSVETALTKEISGGHARIVLDMRHVSYVSSAGLRVVLAAAKKCGSAGGGIAIFGLQPGVHEVFSISGFGKIIPIAENYADARVKLPT